MHREEEYYYKTRTFGSSTITFEKQWHEFPALDRDLEGHFIHPKLGYWRYSKTVFAANGGTLNGFIEKNTNEFEKWATIPNLVDHRYQSLDLVAGTMLAASFGTYDRAEFTVDVPIVVHVISSDETQGASDRSSDLFQDMRVVTIASLTNDSRQQR